jgi:hypothetical protein
MNTRFAGALVLAALAATTGTLHAQDWDKKTIEKMLKDGTKKMASANPDERAEGAGYLLGYITCAYRAQYQPVLVKALKDTNPKVRNTAAQTLEKIQAADAVPDLVALLDDPDKDVQVRAAYALGGMGKAASSAEPGLREAQKRASAQKNSMVEGSIQNALDEISGKRTSNRYKCP